MFPHADPVDLPLTRIVIHSTARAASSAASARCSAGRRPPSSKSTANSASRSLVPWISSSSSCISRTGRASPRTSSQNGARRRTGALLGGQKSTSSRIRRLPRPLLDTLKAGGWAQARARARGESAGRSRHLYAAAAETSNSPAVPFARRRQLEQRPPPRPADAHRRSVKERTARRPRASPKSGSRRAGSTSRSAAQFQTTRIRARPKKMICEALAVPTRATPVPAPVRRVALVTRFMPTQPPARPSTSPAATHPLKPAHHLLHRRATSTLRTSSHLPSCCIVTSVPSPACIAGINPRNPFSPTHDVHLCSYLSAAAHKRPL